MKLIGKLLGVCAIASGLTGCLKDDSLMDPAKTHNVIEFANTAVITSSVAGNVYPAYAINILMDPPTPTVTYNAIVNYAGADNAPEDITVEVEVAAQAVLDKYNTQNSKTLTMLPTTMFTIPNAKVVIPKGQRKVNLPIVFSNTSQLWNKGYALPLRIKSASSGIISGNFSTIIYTISGINMMDGVYLGKIKMGTNDRDLDTKPFAWYYGDIQLVTTGLNTSALRNTYVSTFAHGAMTIGGLPTSITSLVPVLTYDLSTRKITAVANSITSGTPPTAVNNTAVTDSRVDPATMNVYTSFIVKQSGKADMIVYDTLLYKNPR